VISFLKSAPLCLVCDGHVLSLCIFIFIFLHLFCVLAFCLWVNSEGAWKFGGKDRTCGNFGSHNRVIR
jgi:hypothetical protein